MELIKCVAMAIKQEEQWGGQWPEPATEVTQNSNYELEFDAPVYKYTNYRGEKIETGEYEWEDGMPYVEEYDTGDTVTKEEYIAFVAKNPNWYEDMLARRPFLVQEIARLNKVVGATIDEMTALAEEAGVELYINLGQHGGVNPNSDWDSSRC